jgi:rhodanese-related sulfurtransferase
MDFFVQYWYLFLAAIVSGGMLLWPSLGQGGTAARVSASEAVQLMNREKAVVIDVSDPAEFGKAHVNGARNIPLGQLEKSSELPKNKAQPLVVVCPTGARASRGAAQLKKLGHEKVHTLSGGVAAWRDAGLPLEKSGA